MTWHDALTTAEQAAIWATIGGITARIMVRKPARIILRWLISQAIHQAQIADSLRTDTNGGIKDLVDAISNNQPAPNEPKHR